MQILLSEEVLSTSAENLGGVDIVQFLDQLLYLPVDFCQSPFALLPASRSKAGYYIQAHPNLKIRCQVKGEPF